MPAYIIVRVHINDESGYAEYRRMVVPTLETYEGRFLARGGRAQILEGSGTPGRVIILEFPTYDQALSWYTSDEYAPAKRRRQASSDAEAILVEGL
ncbi:MAG: DUF1330 domain-containing protein [bacterium]